MSEDNNNLNFDKIIFEAQQKLVDNQENINKISQEEQFNAQNNFENQKNFNNNHNQNYLKNNNNECKNENNFNDNNNKNFNNNNNNNNLNDNDNNELSNLNIQKEINSNLNKNSFDDNKSVHQNINKSKYDELFSLSNKEEVNILSSSNNNINKLKLSIKSFQDDKDKLKKLSMSSNSTENVSYLEPIEFQYLNDNNIISLESKMQQLENSINRKELSLLVNSINKCSLNAVFDEKNKYNNFTIEPIINLKKLIESTFFFDSSLKTQMLNHYLELENIVYKFRGVKGDGNCFYRSIIFVFLENIIMEKNIMLLKEITTEINIKFSEEYINNLKLDEKYINQEMKFKNFLKDNLKNIKKDLIIQCLYVLIISLDNPSQYKFDTFIVLIKLFIYCSPFDQALIYYLKFILFEYILNNIEKYYTKDFSINLINLLPEEYVINYEEIDKPNLFKIQEYFMEELLKMGTDAERIVIYCTPFVLNCDINIVMYEFDLFKDAINQKLFECYNNKNGKLKIEILYRKTHYDIVYNKEYYLKYKNYLDKISWKFDDITIIKDIDIDNMKRIQNGEEIINENEEKNINVYPSYDLIKNNNNNNSNNNNNNNENSANVKNINAINVCQFCFKEISPNSKSFPLKICQNCLINQIEDKIFIYYLSYLEQIIIQYNQKHFDIEQTLINYFDNQKIEINNNNYQLLNIIYSYSETEFNKILNFVKKKICIICQNNNKGNNIKYNLPCGCVLCSNECINKYFAILLINEIEILKNYKFYSKFIFNNCFCGYHFTINDYYNFKNNFTYLNESINNILKHNFSLKCLKCMKLITSQEDRYVLYLKDSNYKTFDLEEFKHFLCDNCNNSLKMTNKDGIKSFKDIDCQLCNYFGNKNAIHSIKKRKKLKKGEEEDESCIIF